MAVNISKARQKAQEEAAKQSNFTYQHIIWYKTKPGNNPIRLMPPWTYDDSNPNAEQFWREVYMHFGVGPNEVALPCPKETPHGPANDECPVCDEVARLKSSGNPADAEVAKSIRAKQRSYSNVVDLRDPVYTDADLAEWQQDQYNQGKECPFKIGDTKIKIFTYGPQIFKQILDTYAGEVDVTDLQTGYDLSVNQTGSGRTSKYNVQIMPPAKPFTFQGSSSAEEALLDLDSIARFREPSDMQAALEGRPMSSNSTSQSLPDSNMGQKSQQLSAPKTQEPAAALPPPAPQAQAPSTVIPPMEDEEEVDEGQPECFGNKDIYDPKDAECKGGIKDLGDGPEEFDPCPYLKECGALVAPPKKRGRRKAAKAPKPLQTEATSEVDALEQELQNAIS